MFCHSRSLGPCILNEEKRKLFRMQIFQISVYLVMWIYVLFGAMAAGHLGTSKDAWRSSKHVRHQAQENDVIKSDHDKKVLHKTSLASKRKTPSGVANTRRVSKSKSKSNENLKLSFFLRMDRNGDGFVSAREYARAQATAIRDARRVIQNFDQNNDNLVSRDEYLHVTRSSVARSPHKKGAEPDKACSVELIQSCAEKFIRRLVRGKGHVRCGKISVFFKCISKHSRKCNSETRRTVQTTMKSISKSLHAKRQCGSSVMRNAWRNRATVETSVVYTPTEVLACSRDAIRSLLLGKENCDFVTPYKTCLQISSRKLPRAVRRRLRHSSRTVTKVCRRVRGYD